MIVSCVNTTCRSTEVINHISNFSRSWACHFSHRESNSEVNNSTNGTYVNGQRIQSALLNTGDRIQFGTNGIEADVLIDSGTAVETPVNAPAETALMESANPIDQMQLNQISQTFEQQKTQTSIAQSVSSIGLGNFELEPEVEESQTGKYVGIAITLFGVAR